MKKRKTIAVTTTYITEEHTLDDGRVYTLEVRHPLTSAHSFEYTITDASGTVALNSPGCYVTMTDALKAGRQTLMRWEMTRRPDVDGFQEVHSGDGTTLRMHRNYIARFTDLVGYTVTAIEWYTDEYSTEPIPILVLENGTRRKLSMVMSDPEGNGAGFLDTMDVA